MIESILFNSVWETTSIEDVNKKFMFSRTKKWINTLRSTVKTNIFRRKLEIKKVASRKDLNIAWF